MKRPEILDTAKKMVCGDRESDCGTPEDNFRCIAELWSAYKGADFTPLDVAMMMTLLKLGRIKTGTAKNDSFIDAAGYIACGGEIATKPVRGRSLLDTLAHTYAQSTGDPYPVNETGTTTASNSDGDAAKTATAFDWEELRRRWWAFIHEGKNPMPPLPDDIAVETNGIGRCVKTYAQCAGAQPCPFPHDEGCSGWVQRHPKKALEILRKMVDDIDE